MTNRRVLTSNDTAVLSKVFDPESAPNAGTFVDSSLPDDPNVQDHRILTVIAQEEKEVIKGIELTLRDPDLSSPERSRALADAYDRLSALINTYPNSASLRNDRAQLIRLRHGDDILISPVNCSQMPRSYSPAATALSDLDAAICLLSPATPQSAVSPVQGRVLAQAYTQRAALYYAASKQSALRKDNLLSDQTTPPPISSVQGWQVYDFEEAASRDFFLGGRYGNEVGKALAVLTNPTAKLCGQMVQEAIRREFAPSRRAFN